MNPEARYDSQNVFAKILRGELPCKKVYEDSHTLAFHDIRPQAPVHVLVVPKGAYVNANDFALRASDSEIAALQRAIVKVADMVGVAQAGYRMVANVGEDGGQEVPHYHVHVFGGRRLGRMVPKTVEVI